MKSSPLKAVQVCILVTTLLACIAAGYNAYADQPAPGWIDAKGELVAPDAAKKYYQTELTSEPSAKDA